MRLELSKRIFLNFVVVIATFCVLGALLGVHLINRNILNEAQRRVRLNLRSGWSVIHSEIDQIGLFVSALVPGSRVAKAYGAPESQTSRASLEAARQKCGFSAGVAIFVLGAGFFFSRRLTGSLRQLAKAADQISRGKPGKKVSEPTNNDEILDLTRAFNTMAESLHDRDERLQKAYTALESTNASLQKLNTNYLDMLVCFP